MQLLPATPRRTALKSTMFTGMYFPDIQKFTGTKGLITWEKAGYSRGINVSAVFRSEFSIDMTYRNNFTLDSVKLRHNIPYFREPVYGTLSDRASASFSSPKKLTTLSLLYLHKRIHHQQHA